MKAIERLKQYIDFKGFTNSFFEKKITYLMGILLLN